MQKSSSSATETDSSGMLLDKDGKILASSNTEFSSQLLNAGYCSGPGDTVTTSDIQRYLNDNPDIKLGTVSGGHRRDAKLLLQEMEPDLFETNGSLNHTSFHLYIGLSPAQSRYVSKTVNEATRTNMDDNVAATLTVSANPMNANCVNRIL